MAESAQRRARSALLPKAAVAVLLVPDPLSVLLIRRSEREGDPWSGHVALPGGRAELEDVDLAATAIRETAEEVGVLLDRTQLLGALDDVAPRSSVPRIFTVRPFVFGLASQPSLQLSSEVASAPCRSRRSAEPTPAASWPSPSPESPGAFPPIRHQPARCGG